MCRGFSGRLESLWAHVHLDQCFKHPPQSRLVFVGTHMKNRCSQHRRQILQGLVFDFDVVREVALVGDEGGCEASGIQVAEGVSDVGDPGREVVEGLAACLIEHQSNHMGASVIATGDRTKAFMTRGIPDLDFDAVDPGVGELHTEGRFALGATDVGLCVGIENRGLPNTRVPNEHDFEEAHSW